MYGVIYIANAGADNVTRDCDYRAALYRALIATPGCVMFTQWLALTVKTIMVMRKRNA